MFKQRTLEEWSRFILRNATYGALRAIGTTGKCSLKCEELKNLVIHRDSERFKTYFIKEKRMFDHKVFKSSNETVSKYVFTC